MVLIDRLLIGAFLACCSLVTGLLLSFVPLLLPGSGSPLDFTGIIFKLSIVFAVVLFLLAMFGKEEFALKLITAPWRLLEQAFKQ